VVCRWLDCKSHKACQTLDDKSNDHRIRCHELSTPAECRAFYNKQHIITAIVIVMVVVALSYAAWADPRFRRFLFCQKGECPDK
jgi:hypothetical protein